MTRTIGRPVVVALTLILVAAVATLPAAMAPIRLNDSFWIDWVWIDQFAAQLGSGQLYPRWLPKSHGGLGSPVFYYYPPLAFYPPAIAVLAGASVWSSIIATFFLGFLAAGVTMYWWLKDRAQAPLLGAVVFAIAPYHVFNFYTRGALAEFVATAILPLVLLGLRRQSEQGRGGFALTAASYAALIGTHLPLALLGSIFLFGPYVLLKNRRDPARIGPIAAALALGIALAAIYLIPSIMLGEYRSSDLLWQHSNLKPQNWNPWNAELAQTNGFRTVLIIVAALELQLLTLAIRYRSLWAAAGAFYAAMAIGLLPLIWSLPVLSAVQFPFRILPLAELALATAVGLHAGRLVLLPLALLPLLWSAMASATPGSEGLTLADLRTHHPDVPENLPPGERPYSWPSRWAIGVAAQHPRPHFSARVTVEPVFYFPAWRVTCQGRAVETFPAPQTKLLAYRGQRCTRALVWTSAEKIGAAISLLALLTLLGVIGFGATVFREERR